jgi:hypothetical protein
MGRQEHIVRDALPEDCGAIAAIYNEGITEGRSTLETEPRTAADIDEWLGSSQRPYSSPRTKARSPGGHGSPPTAPRLSEDLEVIYHVAVPVVGRAALRLEDPPLDWFFVSPLFPHWKLLKRPAVAVGILEEYE